MQSLVLNLPLSYTSTTATPIYHVVGDYLTFLEYCKLTAIQSFNHICRLIGIRGPGVLGSFFVEKER